MADISLVMYDANHKFGMGVKDVKVGSLVVLRDLGQSGSGTEFTRWIFEEETGHIKLKAKTPDHITLALDVPQVGPETQLCVKEYDRFRSTQKWVWNVQGGVMSITPEGDDSLRVDNYAQNQQEGNKIWLYQMNSTPAQKWRLVAVTVAAGRAAQEGSAAI